MAQQAAASVQEALSAGHKRQLVELINPVNEKALAFMATESLDYPASNMKEFQAIVGVTKELMTQLLGPEAQLVVRRVDEGGLDGDLCAVVSARGAGGERVTAVVWPTAEKLKMLKKMAEDATTSLLVIVNPLWKFEGSLVSDLGVGPWRAANETFLATFRNSYTLLEQRIGAPSSINMARGTRYESGAVVRLLRDEQLPGSYQVYVLAADGSHQSIGTLPANAGPNTRPTYCQLEALIEDARKAKLQIFQVARSASALELERGGGGGASGDGGGGGGGGEAAAGAAGAFYSRQEIEAMDPKQLRRVLTGLGLPGAGTPTKLQQRALAVAAAVEGGASLQDAVAEALRLR